MDLHAIKLHSLIESWERFDTIDLKEIDLLLKKDSSIINERNESGLTALSCVLRNPKCSVEAVKLLLKYGANVNCTHDGITDYGNTPLHVALWCNRDDAIIRLLIEHGANVKARDTSGMTSMCYGLVGGASIDILKLLLECGCHPNACRRHLSGFHCLLASSGGHFSRGKLDELKLLVKHYCLENSDFSEIESLIRRRSVDHTVVEELMCLANNCYREVQVMKSTNIGSDSRLFYFLKRRLSSRIAASCNSPSLSNSEFFRMVSVIVDNDFSQYFDLILNTVGKSTIKAKLQDLRELKVYTIKSYSKSNCMTEKIYLNYESVCELTKYLSAADLFRLNLAYTPDVGPRHGVKDSEYRDNKCPE